MTKIAVRHLGPEWVAALRLSVASIVLLPLAYMKNQSPAASPTKWLKFAWLGLIGNSLPFFLITWGTQFVSSGISGLLMGSIPLMIVATAHFFLPNENLSVPKLLGFILGFIGLIILLEPKNVANFAGEGDALIGELAIILGCVCYVIHSISAKRLGFEQPLRQSSGVLFCAAIFSVLFALIRDPSGLQNVALPGYVASLGLGIFPTAIATVLMYIAIDRAGPSFVSMSNYLVPVFAIGLGAIALGENLEWKIVLALAFILVGIAVSRYAPRRAALS